MSDAPETVVIPPGALASSSVRVDTWLWATRQLKSRSQATAAVRAGHVRVNGEPVKAAYKVRVGDEVRLRIEGFDRILGVVLLLNKRVSYPQARTAYDDRTPERPRVHIPVAMREKGRRNDASWTACAGTTPTSITDPVPRPWRALVAVRIRAVPPPGEATGPSARVLTRWGRRTGE